MFLKLSQNSQENIHAQVLFSFELFLKVYVADFEHLFVCWESYGKKIVFVRNLELTYPAKRHLLKVSNRNSKTRCEIG